MEMETLLWVAAVAAIVLGLAGVLLPLLPGMPLLFGGMLLAAWLDDFARVGIVTVVALGVFAALAWLLAPGERRGWRAFIAAGLAVFAVASSRLYLQVHFPSDVLIGILIAAGWVIGLRVALAGRP